MRVTLHGLTVETCIGDIADQPDMDAVVNAANSSLMPGGGVAGAIHRRAGPGLAEECGPLAPISVGEAVVTGAHGLPNRVVIHVLGPVYVSDHPEDRLLADCYRNALRIAAENNCPSVALPAVSTGIFGYPIEDAAPVALNAVLDAADGSGLPETVRFVLFSEAEMAVFDGALRRVCGR